MSTRWNWIGAYSFAILVALMAGPLLGTVSFVQSYSSSSLQLSGPHLIRLAADGLALVFLWLMAANLLGGIPDNGRGWGFLRSLVLPIAALLTVIFANKAMKTAGLSFVEQIGSARYAWTYAIALVLAGMWFTAVWMIHLPALRLAWSTPSPPRKMPRPSEEEHESGEVEASMAPMAKPIVATNGQIPAMLGRYKVLKELGRGAMGVVYMGKDPTIQRFVAIKTMRLDEIDDPDKIKEFKARFFREAESTGRMSHPNIVTIYDAGEEHNLGFIAMELLEGTPLKQYARKPNLLPPRDVFTMLATVADALEYAHQQGVVHRDIKPANIMITKDQTVKVMDFGIAKMASSSKTQTNIVLGTPTYMSPEQIAGKKVDGRSDIFSLGIVLFELLAGQPPFTADNLSALLFSITHNPHPAILTLREDLPPVVQDILDRALQKELPQRYRRAGEFADDLRSCLHSLAA
ncbi:MAG TPA: serine/threonine-protein kinase [Nitrospiraceae bacterium]|jgi:serine/threonine-protein kinase